MWASYSIDHSELPPRIDSRFILRGKEAGNILGSRSAATSLLLTKHTAESLSNYSSFGSGSDGTRLSYSSGLVLPI